MRSLHHVVLATALLLTACSSGSGDGQATPTANNQPGTVTVLLDSRSGSDSWVQFLLAGATLEGPGGIETDNLLGEARILTVSDPSGEVQGLRLQVAPAATYQALHLMFAPGSGVGRTTSGDNLTVTGPVEVTIPITDGLLHDGTSESWLVIGYDSDALTVQGANAVWAPELTARPDGTEIMLDPLEYPVVSGAELTLTAPMVDGAAVEIRCDAQCSYRDEQGNTYPTQAAFFQALTFDYDVCVQGTITRKGIIDADIICHRPRYAQSRLIGRVLELGANQDRFRFRVQAVNPRGSGPLLEAPAEVWVLTGDARIEAPNGDTLGFGDLAVDRLVKVKWNSVVVGPSGFETYTATEVQIPGGNSARPNPQWQARVASVNVAEGSFVIEPRNGKPIRISNQSVPQATVLVDANTVIERRAVQGSGTTTITLEDIQPGVDRVWIRGIVTGPTTIEASRVRVREE